MVETKTVRSLETTKGANFPIPKLPIECSPAWTLCPLALSKAKYGFPLTHGPITPVVL